MGFLISLVFVSSRYSYFCRLILKSGIGGISLNVFHLLLKTSSSWEKVNICCTLELEILKVVPVHVIFFLLILFIPLKVLIYFCFIFISLIGSIQRI